MKPAATLLCPSDHVAAPLAQVWNQLNPNLPLKHANDHMTAPALQQILTEPLSSVLLIDCGISWPEGSQPSRAARSTTLLATACSIAETLELIARSRGAGDLPRLHLLAPGSSLQLAANGVHMTTDDAASHAAVTLLRAAGLQLGCSVAVITSGSLAGAELGNRCPLTNTAAGLLAGRRTPVYGDGETSFDWLSMDDYARCLASLASDCPADAQIAISGSGPVTWRATLGLLCQRIEAAFATTPALAARFPACPAARQQPVAGLITKVLDRRRQVRASTTPLLANAPTNIWSGRLAGPRGLPDLVDGIIRSLSRDRSAPVAEAS